MLHSCYRFASFIAKTLLLPLPACWQKHKRSDMRATTEEYRFRNASGKVLAADVHGFEAVPQTVLYYSFSLSLLNR